MHDQIGQIARSANWHNEAELLRQTNEQTHLRQTFFSACSFLDGSDGGGRIKSQHLVTNLSILARKSPHPAKNFKISEPKQPPTNVSELHKCRRSADFEALNWWNVWSGIWFLRFAFCTHVSSFLINAIVWVSVRLYVQTRGKAKKLCPSA